MTLVESSPSRPTPCPRCGCWTAHIAAVTSTVGDTTILVDVLIWCENCDEVHPYEQGSD